MALKTDPDISYERKKDTETINGKTDESKKNNVPEYAKKSKVNKKRNYKNWKNVSTKINTSFIFSPSGLPNPMFCEEYCVNNMPIMPISCPVLDCYSQYVITPLAYNWSSTVNSCNISSPIWSYPGLPASVPANFISTQVCHYTCPVTPVIFAPVLPIAPPSVDIFSPTTECSYLTNQTINSTDFYSAAFVESLTGEPIIKAFNAKSEEHYSDPIEFYLALPKELFPPAKLLTVDQNSIVDEFCREVDIQEHVSWLLDLEFGVPRSPVTRAIATYDVQHNSVRCKNTPGVIHPGFESCSQTFKRVILFSYDCVVSAWYRGYMVMTADATVANFQEWLQLPMQRLGMCWS